MKPKLGLNSHVELARNVQVWVMMCFFVVCKVSLPATDSSEESTEKRVVVSILEENCVQCHGNEKSKARLNLEKLSASSDFLAGFQTWEAVLEMVERGEMPPDDERPLTTEHRNRLLTWIRSELAKAASSEKDPGPVTIRRLTSGEYNYVIEDLTGLNLELESFFTSDAVGGEGFANMGDVQFMQDSVLERYLEAAKRVASHAVIGAGPLQFYRDPGRTGRELSAIHRIRQIYRDHGFRTGAGEGAEAFGLDLYGKALAAAWLYEGNREKGEEARQRAADSFEVESRFVGYIHSVLSRDDLGFPMSLFASSWKNLPRCGDSQDCSEAVLSTCFEIGQSIRDWQKALASSVKDEEESAILTGEDIEFGPNHHFDLPLRWPKGAHRATLVLATERAGSDGSAPPTVIWTNARIHFQFENRANNFSQPLAERLTPAARQRLLTVSGDDSESTEEDFHFIGPASVLCELSIPVGAQSARLSVTANLDIEVSPEAIVRCSIDDGWIQGETVASTGVPSALLANPRSESIESWRQGVVEFADLLPEISHREPAPSDRDPIPAPYDGGYNTSERNWFHYHIKYHRDDQFLYQWMLDDATKRELDVAWLDLLTSFDYFDANFNFVLRQAGVAGWAGGLAGWDGRPVNGVPTTHHPFLIDYLEGSRASEEALIGAQQGHVWDLLSFAEKAWRRPLTRQEANQIRLFYQTSADSHGLDHEEAIRASLVRVLISPNFLFRPELGEGSNRTTALTSWELATRLSFALWSSIPDKQLWQLAASGELRKVDVLKGEIRRLLNHAKARRLASEFFGQWLGFYRFNDYGGVDDEQFPEFDSRLKTAMHDEAIAFFEHIIRRNRPPGEILFGQYSFLNQTLAEHYQLPAGEVSSEELILHPNLIPAGRGGLLGLGVILTSTSAPRRTSIVKRGDWILRRLLDTPTPPPPDNAGSLPPEDTSAQGITAREQLEAHRRDSVCYSCHSKIDPLGFALEGFDAIGRSRNVYEGGQPIDDVAFLEEGTPLAGVEGLRAYLKTQDELFYRNLSIKWLGYVLGRGRLPSDERLIERMVRQLQQGAGFQELAVTLLTSEHFLKRRSVDFESGQTEN